MITTAIQQPRLSRALLLTMATASGVAAANIYYNQPLLADMARSMHVSQHQAGYVANSGTLFPHLGIKCAIQLDKRIGGVRVGHPVSDDREVYAISSPYVWSVSGASGGGGGSFSNEVEPDPSD